MTLCAENVRALKDGERKRIYTHLVVVDVPLTVDSLDSLRVLLAQDTLLHDLGCDLGADLNQP